MSVASTKAFYAQIAAGFLLAFAIADRARRTTDADPTTQRAARRAARAARRDGARRSSCGPSIADAAPRSSPRRGGTGRSSATAPTASRPREIRIKLSELCYKSIACDATEDKKHIDLSSEPLILVCAAGLVGSTADDVAKEVAIYRAHKAAPIVIATEGEPSASPPRSTVHHGARDRTRGWPSCCRPWSATSSATRRRSRSTPRRARCARRAPRSRRRSSGDGPLDARRRAARPARARAQPLAAASSTACAPARYNGHLEASTAVRLASLLRYALGISPLDAYQVEYGKVGTPERRPRGPDRGAHRGPSRS